LTIAPKGAELLAARLYTVVNPTRFREYVAARDPLLLSAARGQTDMPRIDATSCWHRRLRTAHPDLNIYHSAPALCEEDEGLQAFIDTQNSSFKAFLQKLLDAKKITNPRLVQEAELLIADRENHVFNYGRELLRMASTGRGRLAGADALQGATEAAGRMWELLWRLEAYAGTETWETRFRMSAERGGIRGTVRAVANNLIGHFAQRLRKRRAGISTLQHSQIGDRPFDVPGRASSPAGEWQEWKSAILQELVSDLRRELANHDRGKHWESRVRNLRWALAIAAKQMEIPYERRSMPEVMAEIPELRDVGRGGLQQTLKNLIDDARNRVVAKLGSEKEQAVAHSLQTRHRRTGAVTRAEGVRPSRSLAERLSFPTSATLSGFGEYLAASKATLSPPKPTLLGKTTINPFPAMRKQLKRLLPPVHQAHTFTPSMSDHHPLWALSSRHHSLVKPSAPPDRRVPRRARPRLDHLHPAGAVL
jgi:hypothetical protein